LSQKKNRNGRSLMGRWAHIWKCCIWWWGCLFAVCAYECWCNDRASAAAACEVSMQFGDFGRCFYHSAIIQFSPATDPSVGLSVGSRRPIVAGCSANHHVSPPWPSSTAFWHIRPTLNSLPDQPWHPT